MNMKKTMILVLLVFTTVLSTYAQGRNEKSNRMGVRAGWHSALMVIDGAGLATTDPLNAFYVGFFNEKRMGKIFYFGSGLEYFQNGFESTVIDLKRKLHYISVPIYLKLKLGPVYATGGTALNFKVAEENIIWDGAVDPLEGNKTNVFDLPVSAGLGVQIFMFSVEARYFWGMIDVNHNVKNQYFQLGFAVFF